MRFKKKCIVCGEEFRPKGKYQKICSRKCHKPKGWLAKKTFINKQTQ